MAEGNGTNPLRCAQNFQRETEMMSIAAMEHQQASDNMRWGFLLSPFPLHYHLTVADPSGRK